MKKLLMLVFVGFLLFNGCEKKDEEEVTKEDIKIVKIGGLLALTGSASQWGKNCKNGIDLAVEQLNATNNNKIQYKMIYQDTKAEAKTAISAFHKLKSEKVKFIIGDVSSSVNLAIAPLADKEKIIVISPAATSPKLTNSGEYTFRTWNSDAEEAIVMSSYCKKNNIDNITLLLINNDYGVGLQKAFTENLKNTNIKINKVIMFEPNTKNFKPYLSKIDKQTKALYIVGYPNELQRLFKTIYEMNIKTKILGTSVFNDPILKDIKLENEILYSYPLQVENNTYREFIKSYNKKYNSTSGIASDTAYDAMMIIDEVINKENYLKYMFSIKEFEGASGIISFDKYGDVHKPMSIKSLK